jgi:hypothetical protein
MLGSIPARRAERFARQRAASRSASLVPVQCPRGRVRRPRWTPRSDRFRTAHAWPCPAGHRPLHRARQPNRKRCGQGNGRTARKAFGHPRSPRPQGGSPGHAEPSPVGPAFAAWQPRSAPRWQHCQRDRYHASDQAAAWCRSSVQAAPRRIALLGRLRVERKANGEASSVLADAEFRGPVGAQSWRVGAGVMRELQALIGLSAVSRSGTRGQVALQGVADRLDPEPVAVSVLMNRVTSAVASRAPARRKLSPPRGVAPPTCVQGRPRSRTESCRRWHAGWQLLLWAGRAARVGPGGRSRAGAPGAGGSGRPTARPRLRSRGPG